MAKAKKSKPSTRSLAAIDLAGQYGDKLVVIQGLVSTNSQGGFPGSGKDDYRHGFDLAAWREVGGPLIKRELYVLRKVRGGRDWPGVFQKLTLHRMEVLLSKDQTRAIFARRLMEIGKQNGPTWGE